MTVIACCKAAGQFLLTVLISKDVSKKQEFGDGLPPGSDVYMNRKSSCIRLGLFMKWFREHTLKQKALGKVILPLDGHRAYCPPPLYCFRLLFKLRLLSLVYRVTVLIPYSLWISVVLGL
jgi:hypothetical protein